ncbi:MULTISPECIES: DUF302 domain-containing protein [Brachymonas]|uniref:DUF302 domain-containing protein n=1 Tax=Brachymonas TaxID=28219 RepID=UPI0016A57F99|nr:DUF302 domain-containing protein [Brachymonas sp. J145]MEE1653322.1 DUF302 domain-containing protein [Brachymonas sp. J145]NLX16088.1 DUF302 domain-containing protein [Ramlibacter sp.]
MVWPFLSRTSPARQPADAESACRPAFALTVEVHRPFHAALGDVRKALEAEDLQIWQEQDLSDAAARRNQVLLSVCAPRVLEQVRQIDPDLCVLLPLRASVRELAPGQVRVALQDPLTGAAAGEDWQRLCQLHYGLLRRVVDRLLIGPPDVF